MHGPPQMLQADPAKTWCASWQSRAQQARTELAAALERLHIFGELGYGTQLYQQAPPVSTTQDNRHTSVCAVFSPGQRSAGAARRNSSYPIPVHDLQGHPRDQT